MKITFVSDYVCPYCIAAKAAMLPALLPEDNAPVPEGFDMIELPEAEYLVFQGEPFREENYCQAIQAVQHAISKYDPALIGYDWDDENPRIQLEPRGERGYIEMRAVKQRKAQ